MRVLVLNSGSATVKFQVLEPDSGRRLREGTIEFTEATPDYDRAVAGILRLCADDGIEAVGHRVVHGGERFHEPVRIDAEVEAAIQASVPLAPLHNPANLAGIRAARATLPEVVHVAVFDTAFHARLPRRARTYAIDPELARAHGIRRFGFHGTSHEFVAHRAADFLGRPLDTLRLVSCHLGSGASVCAVEFGHSVDTSMGMTPLEGLVMRTRAGDLDPGAVLALLRHGTRTAEDVDTILNHRSGLAALAGTDGDMRRIEELAADGDDRARLAMAVFAHRVRKYIGAYAAAMGGLDAVVLTGGIGQNSPAIRRRVLQRLDFLGLLVDEDRNADARVDHETPVADIATASARVRALVVATDEELSIARATAALAGGRADIATPAPIPIAVSARHVHLDADTFAHLFGPAATPTRLKDLSQPGQYACTETVNLVGPRGRIEKVRVLGPLRARNQVEISRTDEFTLGVDAPVRRSGNTAGSAPVTLEGPLATVHLAEGLICARRHIHMTPADARRYGVEHGDEVEVAISGGTRDLVFGDVVVRVSPRYTLEMHIDTDEANAAELPQRSDGAMVYSPVPLHVHADLRSRRLLRKAADGEPEDRFP